jgi:hypothetical protein
MMIGKLPEIVPYKNVRKHTFKVGNSACANGPFSEIIYFF